MPKDAGPPSPGPQHDHQDHHAQPHRHLDLPLQAPAAEAEAGAAGGKPETPPAPANDDRKLAIVTVKRRGSRFGEVPDLTLEEHQRRGEAADMLFREIVRRATE